MNKVGKMQKDDNLQIIDFVKKTTEAITIISESTKSIKEITESLKDTTLVGFKNLDGKMDGLMTMFKYVIIPLISGILALVGVKTLFKL